MSYVVAVKRSARQASAAAGEWVRDRGVDRTFDSKQAAREWASGLGEERTVWVQDAHPADDSVDGYLVARRVQFWVSHDEEPPGEQATLADGG